MLNSIEFNPIFCFGNKFELDNSKNITKLKSINQQGASIKTR